MLENYRFRSFNHTDLNMYQCGHEDCASGHSYGPAVRDHYLIHYIHSGKGFFQVEGNTYHLHKGEGFLICPDIITFYQADHDDPWQYSWVGFHGLKAEHYLMQANLTAHTPTFCYTKDNFMDICFSQMFETKKMARGREIRLIGLLCMFLSELVESAQDSRFLDNGGNRKEIYIKKALEYIERNYSRKITITEISQYIGLDRSYLGSMFKELLNTSLQEYLINFRMNKACELMKNNSLTIGDISRSVGYDDPLLFSRIFKQVKQQPPREYRKSCL